MVTTKYLKRKDYREQPWKNGRGNTREIAVDSKDPFRWRLSSASLNESGPFSEFSGYQRVLVLLEGARVKLSFNGKPAREISSLSPVKFSGDWKTQCEVLSPGEDLNLFTHEKSSKGNIYTSRVGVGEEVQYPLIGNEHFLFLVSGKLSVLESNVDERVTLLPYETYWVSRNDKKEYLNLRATGDALSQVLWGVIHVS